MSTTGSTANLHSSDSRQNFPGVSVVAPILNEELHISAAVEAILQQEYPGELELILAIAPSKDRTLEIAREIAARDPRVIIVENPTGKTAAGLNNAIAHSNFPIICRIDGHAEVPRDYIRNAVQIMDEKSAVNVGGVMAAVGVTGFEKAVARAMRSPLGVGAARFHVGGVAGEVETVYLGTFRKQAILDAGGFDERFIRAQDWELNHRLRKAGGLIWFDPRLVVTYRPRPNLRALAKQYFQYGTWRRVVSRQHSNTINFRYLAPPTALMINLLSIALGLSLSPVFLIPIAVYLLMLIGGSLVIGQDWTERIRLPFVLFTMHMAWGLGFLVSRTRLDD